MATGGRSNRVSPPAIGRSLNVSTDSSLAAGNNEEGCTNLLAMVKEQDGALQRLDAEMRRHNLIVTGMEDEADTSVTPPQPNVGELLACLLDCDVKEVPHIPCSYVGKAVQGKRRPILLDCRSHPQMPLQLLKATRKLKSTKTFGNVFVNRDLPLGIRTEMSRLRKRAATERQAGKSTRITNNTLFVNDIAVDKVNYSPG